VERHPRQQTAPLHEVGDGEAEEIGAVTLFAFKLDGKGTLPPGPGPAPPPNVPEEIFSPLAADAGAEPYRVYCSRCHGGETHSLNIIPDLRRSVALTSAALWKSIVIDGALEPNGMISWSQFLTPEEAETIRAYVAAQARTLQQSEGQAPAPSPLEPPTIEPPIIDPAAIDPTAL
jgi:mono/diheme cytochrome c family protein